MTDALPDPLVPSNVDLRDFAFMPLDVRRLLTSSTWIDAADEPRLGHVLVCLWSESWHQVPAASLPDNDRVLARFAMCDAKAWSKLRDKAIQGWIRCRDGRLYHPVVAEKALEAWQRKLDQRERTRAATEARERKRRERDEQRYVDRDDKRDDEREMQGDDLRNVVQGTGTGTGTVEKEDSPAVNLDAQPEIGNSTHANRSARAHRIPETWEPDETSREYARSLGLDPDRTAREFHNYWRAEGGQRARKVNWDLAFRNRCDQIADGRRPSGAGSRDGRARPPSFVAALRDIGDS
jgi:hypothetical protein